MTSQSARSQPVRPANGDAAPAVVDENWFERTAVERARRGDLDAFNDLVEMYQALVYRVSLRILGDPGRAEDATQDAFVRAWSALDQHQGGSFRSWLLRIATNRCYDILRAERRRPAESFDAQPIEQEPWWSSEPSTENPDSFTTRQELSSYLEAALQRLPDDQRVAIVLSDVHGHSYDEIAQISEVSLGTVKSRISRGRARLRELLTTDPRARELLGASRRHVDSDQANA
jgi:RNA polymerase sigma-70 factor, ECF subfamily